MNYLSTNIKYLRQSKKMTQEELARAVDKSRVLISQWESGYRGIRIKDIIKLSDYFNIPMNTLVGKDLRNKDSAIDELDVLFNETRSYLNDSDKAIIKTILLERKKQVDEDKKD